MKKSSSELKGMAKGLLAGHYGLLIGAVLVISFASIIVSGILTAVFPQNNTLSQILYTVCTFIVGLLSAVLSVGLSKMVINISRGQDTRLSDLLYGFTHQPDRIILACLLISLLSGACMLPGGLFLGIALPTKSILLSVLAILAFLAGIVFAVILEISYSQVFYLYLDAPEKGVLQLMRESRAMMKGNKGRYFYLQLSFIGLALLSVLTCFIGMLWLIPYMEMTTILFYRNLTGEV